jgi:hypothetical protein
MSNPWSFGWTQLLTIIGFCITIGIAIGGFRTFDRWRREKLEERRIETAIEALTIAYETKYVFQHIRSALSQGYEWADMPQREHESEEIRNRVGPYYASIKRINQNKDFFERVWRLQPRCMAVFGPNVEATFIKLHQARRNIEVAAQMLAEEARRPFSGPKDDATINLYEQLRRDIWDHGNFEPEKNRVGKLLAEFSDETVAFARPVIAGLYKSPTTGSWKKWMIRASTRKLTYWRFGKGSMDDPRHRQE